MSNDLRARLIGSRPLIEAEKAVGIEAGIELSAILSGVGADLLAAAGAIRALYAHDMPPDRHDVSAAELAVARARTALRAFDEATRRPA